MSKGISSTAAKGARAGLVVIAFLPVMLYAANPNVSADPNVPSREKKAVAPLRTASLDRSRRPVLRSPASFRPEMPFREAIDILRNCTRPPLNIIVLWREIGENAGVYQDTPIGIDGVAGLTVGQYLDSLLLSLSAGSAAKLGYTVRNGVITIATTEALPAPKMETRVYDVSDLVAEPARYFFPPFLFNGMGYGGQMMGPVSGYGGGLGAGYGPGASYLPGSPYGYNGAGGLPGLVQGAYGGAGRSPTGYRRR